MISFRLSLLRLEVRVDWEMACDWGVVLGLMPYWWLSWMIAPRITELLLPLADVRGFAQLVWVTAMLWINALSD
jgi:hypothetical protein